MNVLSDLRIVNNQDMICVWDDTHVVRVRANIESLVLSGSAETPKRKCQLKKACYGETTPGPSIIIMHQQMLCY
jgi:hypothetical protein